MSLVPGTCHLLRGGILLRYYMFAFPKTTPAPFNITKLGELGTALHMTSR